MSASEGQLRLSVLETETRLRRFRRREEGGGYTGQRVLNMELPERRKRGRPQRSFMDVVKEDMQRFGGTGGCWDRVSWRQMICCGDP